MVSEDYEKSHTFPRELDKTIKDEPAMGNEGMSQCWPSGNHRGREKCNAYARNQCLQSSVLKQ